MFDVCDASDDCHVLSSQIVEGLFQEVLVQIFQYYVVAVVLLEFGYEFLEHIHLHGLNVFLFQNL